MTERKLKEYFENSLTVEQLSLDLKDSQRKTSHDVTSVYVDTFNEGEFQIKRDHLIKLCDDAINGLLSETDLNTIAFALISSDYFFWDNETADGEIIADTLFDWDNPEINFPLTRDNFIKWKDYLQTGNYQLK